MLDFFLQGLVRLKTKQRRADKVELIMTIILCWHERMTASDTSLDPVAVCIYIAF